MHAAQLARAERVRAATRAHPARAGRVRTWVPLFLAFWLGVWLCESLTEDVLGAGFTTIDTRRVRLEPSGASSNQRLPEAWEAWLARSLAALPPPSSLDPGAAAEIAALVARVPFVAEVRRAEVVWPDGVELDVRLRQPIACVLIGAEYAAVSAEGVVLPRVWTAPPWVGHGHLPVIGPNDGAFDALRPGDRLKQMRHLDALAVALSMRAGLAREDFEAMGPALIDATGARRASVSDPGVLLKLDGRKLVFFGRAPDTREPGELPAEFKWAALSRALAEERRDAQHQWAVLDVRWDVPAIQWRPSEASPASAASTNGVQGTPP